MKKSCVSASVNYSKYILLTGCINILMYVLVDPTFLNTFLLGISP